MTKAGLVCALISVLSQSCGGDEAEAAIIGVWGIRRPDGCGVLFRLEPDGSCAYGEICELQSGDFGIERHEGICTLYGNHLSADWSRSTCEEPPTVSVRYTADESRLIWEASDGRLIFERLDDESGGGSALLRYGCWVGDTLDPRNLEPVE
jgi:hypothetical protein